MLSVLIPVYQVDVKNLVLELDRQCNSLGIIYEIVILDDGSSDEFRTKNKGLMQACKSMHYHENSENIGRSASRNKLIDLARYDWCWFLDCDSDARQNPSLAETFWKSKKNDTLISGGREYYSNEPENRQFYLHWLWGSERELLDPELRMKDPINHFLSNNFFLNKNLLLKVKFNTKIKGYGYEDTFFAAQLIQEGFSIVHIKNPVIHAGLDAAPEFITKIEESLKNILLLEKICLEEKQKNPLNSKLIRWNKFFRHFLPGFIRIPLFRIPLSSLRKKLFGKRPNLLQFDLYRLFFLLSLK